MLSKKQNITLQEPKYYHREYSNDIESPKNLSWSDQTNCEKAQRLLHVALPFTTLYKPFSFPISLGMGGLRTVSNIFQLVSCIKDGKTSNTTAYHTLQTTIAEISVAGTVFAHPLGMFITTAQDLVIEVSQLTEHAKNGDHKKALECCANILNNTLYLALFLHGGLEVSIASLGVQTLLGIYHAQDALRQENYLEAAGHLGMAVIRGNQMMHQVSILNYKWKLESLTKKSNDNQVNAIKANYWELTPGMITEMDGKTIYLYPAKVLGTRQTDGSIEILLNVTSHDGGKFTQAWFKTAPGHSDLLKEYSLGDKVIVNINPLQPQEASISTPKTLSESIPVRTSWPHTEKKAG